MSEKKPLTIILQARDMTFRDYAAVAMMQAGITEGGVGKVDGDQAYRLADELIAARERKP